MCKLIFQNFWVMGTTGGLSIWTHANKKRILLDKAVKDVLKAVYFIYSSAVAVIRIKTAAVMQLTGPICPAKAFKSSNGMHFRKKTFTTAIEMSTEISLHAVNIFFQARRQFF